MRIGKGAKLIFRLLHRIFIPSILCCSPMFSAATWLRSTPSTLTCPFKILTPSGLHSPSTTFPRQHHIHHTNHGRIMPGLSQNHLGTFWAVMEQIRSITDSFRHFYYLDHTSTLTEVSVLYLLFQSLLLLHTSPLSCSIKGLDIL